jgi:hypothetical protein
VEAMSTKLHKLSDRLGDEHDLAVLGDLAGRSAAQVGRKADSALQKLIKKRRRKLRKRALAVGLPFYAEKPAHFQTRLRQYFRRWW